MMKQTLKKLAALTLSVCLLLCAGMSAAAESSAAPIDINNATKYVTLTISDAHAKMESYYLDKTMETVKIEMKVTLEKHSFLWFWNDYTGTWSKSGNSNTCKISVGRSDLPSGTYRVRSEITATLRDGTVQNIKIYSSEASVP